MSSLAGWLVGWHCLTVLTQHKLIANNSAVFAHRECVCAHISRFLFGFYFIIFIVCLSVFFLPFSFTKCILTGSFSDSDNANHRTNRSFSKMKHNRKVCECEQMLMSARVSIYLFMWTYNFDCICKWRIQQKQSTEQSMNYSMQAISHHFSHQNQFECAWRGLDDNLSAIHRWNRYA